MKTVHYILTQDGYSSPYYDSQEEEDAWSKWPDLPDNPKNWKKPVNPIQNVIGVIILIAIYYGISLVTYNVLTGIAKTLGIMESNPILLSIIIKIISFIVAPMAIIFIILNRMANYSSK